MAEISNATLAVLVLTALVVVIAGTVINLNSVQRFTGLTGFLFTDTGTVNLSINATLAIQVNSTYPTINFGSCNTRAATSYWCSSNDTTICDGSVGQNNCTGDTVTSQYIRLDNVGNVDGNITMTSECTAATLIGGSSPAFNFVTTNCNGTPISVWTPFLTTSQDICQNLSFNGGALRLYANVTIPYNAVGSSGACSGNQSTIWFTAAPFT